MLDTSGFMDDVTIPDALLWLPDAAADPKRSAHVAFCSAINGAY